jgi:uncharacterized membrane protein
VSLFTTILFLHVLGATVWTGGHLVLAVTVCTTSAGIPSRS